jgi:broad specificity phosphatase PhoE
VPNDLIAISKNSPNTIMFIRHGEKPGESGAPFGVNQHGKEDSHALSVRGWQRAGALAGLFKLAQQSGYPGLVTPAAIYATAPNSDSHSTREFNTAQPLADALKVQVNVDYPHGHEHHLATHIAGQTDPTLVVWHHGEIPAAIAQFPVANMSDVPSAWPEERFDLVWVLKRNADASQYTFSQLNQKLLDGDQS